MSSETREFRPFNVDPKLAGALDGAVLRFGDLACLTGRSVLIEDRTFSQRPCSLEWAGEDGFEQFKHNLRQGSTDSRFGSSSLSLVVVVRSGYLKRQEAVFERPLTDIDSLERVISLSNAEERAGRRALFTTDTHGTFVEAYLALSKAFAPKPLQAWRKSTWLAKATFRVRCEADNELFRPRPLNAEERERLGLRDETVFFVELDSVDDLTTDLSETAVPVLWVDEELLTVLDQHRSSPAATFMQRQMVLHLITSVVNEFSSLPDTVVEMGTLKYEDQSGSLVGRIARMIASPRATSEQITGVLRKMREDPRTVAAWAEDAVRLRLSALESLRADT